jgi:hypothetical protein
MLQKRPWAARSCRAGRRSGGKDYRRRIAFHDAFVTETLHRVEQRSGAKNILLRDNGRKASPMHVAASGENILL